VEWGAVKGCGDFDSRWVRAVRPAVGHGEADVDPVGDAGGGNLVGQGLEMNAPIR
jgi:hypothetical protein